jgi:hypothetical protein
MRVPVLITSLLFVATVAAQEFELRNDSLADGSTGAIQVGFVAGEVGGAVFDTAPGNYPLKILKVQIFWTSFTGGGVDVEEASINFYQGGAESPPSPTLVLKLDGPVLHDGYLNEFDVSNYNIVFDEGPFAVGLQFLQAPDPYNGPSLVTDTDGCQIGKNLIYAIPGGWTNGCVLGISGDFVIRVICEYVGDVAEVSGHVTLGAWLGDPDGLPMEVQIRDGEVVLDTIDTQLDAYGDYYFVTHSVGQHDVWAKAAHWLAEKKQDVQLGGAPVIDWSMARNGDVNDDNAVNLPDLNHVLIAFGSTSGGWTDLDGSGQVDLLDLNFVLAFFGEVGEP